MLASAYSSPKPAGTAEDIRCRDVGMERREGSLLPSAAAKGLEGALCAPEWRSGHGVGQQGVI